MATSMKKKYTQNDLRRLMSEQKAKSAPVKTSTTKIQSPLAKYNDLGQLMCVLCKTIVRSEDVWKVHINAKQHKQNVELAKKSVGSVAATAPPAAAPKSTSTASATKRMAPPPVPEIPAKMPRSILKNSNNQAESNGPQTFVDTKSEAEKNALPGNFFDAPRGDGGGSGGFYETTLIKTSIKTNLVNIKRGTDADKVDETAHHQQQQQPSADETLPEGFFDDPIKDAKARHLEYKDPLEDEWEKFQQEIKEASDFSNAIIAEEQEEAITDRQIDEIDEQIRNWNRVLELEKMKETVNTKVKEIEMVSDLSTKERRQQAKPKHKNVTTHDDDDNDEDDDDDDDDDVGDIDEYLDWRSKIAYK